MLYCAAGSAGKDYEKQLEALQAQGTVDFPTPATVMFRLKGVLQTANMGTRLYFTGTEPFMGLALKRSARSRHRSQVDHHRTPRLGEAARPVRPLQRLHRRCHHQPCDVQPLRPDVARARSLFAPSWRFPRCLHRRRSARRSARSRGDLQMTGEAEFRVRVAETETVADGIRRLRLVPHRPRALPLFSGGAHTVLTMHDEDRVLRNPYSLMGSPFDPSSYQISVLRTARLARRLDLRPREAERGQRAFHHRAHQSLPHRSPRPPASAHRRRHRHHALHGHDGAARTRGNAVRTALQHALQIRRRLLEALRDTYGRQHHTPTSTKPSRRSR